MKVTKVEILSGNDCLWKIDIQRNEVDGADVDIISIQLIDSCDEVSPNCHSKLYNLNAFGHNPCQIYQDGLGKQFASNWNGYIILQIERLYVVKF